MFANKKMSKHYQSKTETNNIDNTGDNLINTTSIISNIKLPNI